MRLAKPLQILVAAGVMLALAHVLILQFAGPGNHFYMFIYERGPVQHVTLFVTFVVIAMLAARFSRFRWNRAQLKALQQGKGQPSEDLARQLDAVSKTYAEEGASAATSRAEQVAQEHMEEIHRAHEAITHLTGVLPVLGFLGTLLGLNQGLFVAFGGGAPKTEAVMTFVTAFATTLDNTILAVFCSVPLFAAGFVLARAEKELSARLAAHVRAQFGLKKLPESVKAPQADLRKLMVKIAADAKAAFAEIIESSAKNYRESLEKVVTEVFATQRKHDGQIVNQVAAEVAAGLGQAVGRVGDLIERQNGRLAADMIRQVGQLEKTLQNRTPEEVVIRYQHNGHAH